MIRVTIEYVPQGDERRAENIGTIQIANNLSGDEATGKYTAVASTPKRGICFSGGFKHRRRDDVFHLVARALRAFGLTN